MLPQRLQTEASTDRRLLLEEGRTAIDGDPLNFEIDKSVENKLQITVAPDGYLKRIIL